MDVNYLIGLLIMIAFSLLGYSHYEHLSQDITYCKSDIDNNEYLVRNREDKAIAANLLAKIRIKLEKICKLMKDKYPNDPSVIRLNKRFNSRTNYIIF